MRGRKSAATPQPGVMNRVHRPHLTPAQAALEAQYRPASCHRCAEAGRRLVGSPYVLDPQSSADNALQFYCLECGFYTTVQRSTGEAYHA